MEEHSRRQLSPQVSRLSIADHQRLLHCLAQLYEPVDAEAFGRHLVRLIAEMIPGSIVGFDEIDPSSDTYRLAHNCGLDPAWIARHFQRLTEVYQQNPIYGYIQSGGQAPAVKISDLRPQREIRRTDFYQDFFKPMGLEYQIAVHVPVPGHIVSLSVNRDRDFLPAVTEILGHAAPHIVRAYQLVNRRPVDTARWTEGLCGLSEREVEVLRWIAEGKRNTEIGIILGIAPRTVEKHVETILRKTLTETRSAAVAAASRASARLFAVAASASDSVSSIERPPGVAR